MLRQIALWWDGRTTDAGRRILSSAGLLVLRVGLGSMMIGLHGWPKLAGFSEKAGSFPDPLGIGSTASFTLALGAEFFCSIAVVLGLLTRFAVIPLIITMAVAAFIFHANDPWAKKQLALVYLTPFVALLLCGGGQFSLDALIWRRLTTKQGSVESRPQ
ncbi:MAG: DoxX family protein [Phycisphaerae bacterium]